ncbi:hypothetical protein ABGB07_23530 [Micromonosporaceae bacterium B7E4]
MATDREPSSGDRAREALAGCGCCLAFLLAIFVAVAAIAVLSAVTVPFLGDAREALVPLYAETACRITDCGPVAMAIAGWAVWAIGVGAGVTLILLFHRRRRLFKILAAPAGALIVVAAMFVDYRKRGGPDPPTIAELAADMPTESALVIGLRCALYAGILAVLLTAYANARLRHGPRADVWRAQLVLIGAPLLLVPALGLALLLA